MSKPRLTQRNEIFNQQVKSKVITSRYDLSVRKEGSYQMGVLYPIYCRNDILPGDRFSISCQPFLRFLPMVAPSLTNVDIEIRFFFIPYRILWSYWKGFISPSTADDVKLVEPSIPLTERAQGATSTYYYNVGGSLYDYMGIASINWNNTNGVFGGQNWTGVGVNNQGLGKSAPFKAISDAVMPNDFGSIYIPIERSAYPFAAYNFIWNEYFRDENLQDEAVKDLLSGNGNKAGNFFLRRVNWEKDYFSSALPFVTQSIFTVPSVTDGMTIEELRAESALTRWLEKQAIGGHRYQESILTHFGVNVPDEAAQIPVYLGGGKIPVQVGSVEQTSPVLQESAKSIESTTPLATLGGKGTASGYMHIDNVLFKEHGVVLGLMYIRPKAVYADVTPKDLMVRGSRHDYFWPDFADLGDESIDVNQLNPGITEFDASDFGYTMRYADYRTSFDQVHGQLRPSEPLEFWTQARNWMDYTGASHAQNVEPFQQSSDFIACKPSNRIFADTTDSDNIVGEIITFVDASRPMPNYIDPKID